MKTFNFSTQQCRCRSHCSVSASLNHQIFNIPYNDNKIPYAFKYVFFQLQTSKFQQAEYQPPRYQTALQTKRNVLLNLTVTHSIWIFLQIKDFRTQNMTNVLVSWDVKCFNLLPLWLVSIIASLSARLQHVWNTVRVIVTDCRGSFQYGLWWQTTAQHWTQFIRESLRHIPQKTNRTSSRHVFLEYKTERGQKATPELHATSVCFLYNKKLQRRCGHWGIAETLLF